MADPYQAQVIAESPGYVAGTIELYSYFGSHGNSAMDLLWV